ncbi:MAG: hypothetical protein HY769_03305 [Candidatus Stahlbacteria bacterium]|nr:hypothetical protein [Candidatus Stahlbacteria bacterium]
MRVKNRQLRYMIDYKIYPVGYADIRMRHGEWNIWHALWSVRHALWSMSIFPRISTYSLIKIRKLQILRPV